MTKNATQILLSLILVFIGFGFIFVLSNFLENNRPTLPENYEDEDLALKGSKIKGYALGSEGLIADWYWMQSLQYIGNKVIKNTNENLNLENLTSLNPRLLYPLLDNATDLDPKFLAVYSYGAVVLPAIDANQAIKITEKGIANNPNEWRLYQHLGYIYWRLKDYPKAAETYENGSQIEGAPPFMKMMSAQMKSQGGSKDTARDIYQQMLKDAQDSKTKEIAELRLMQIDSIEEREAITSTLETFKAKNNRCANNWSEIFPLLKAVKLPNDRDFRIDKANNLVDPSGAPYVLDKQSCRVLLSDSTKIPFQ